MESGSNDLSHTQERLVQSCSRKQHVRFFWSALRCGVWLANRSSSAKNLRNCSEALPAILLLPILLPLAISYGSGSCDVTTKIVRRGREHRGARDYEYLRHSTQQAVILCELDQSIGQGSQRYPGWLGEASLGNFCSGPRLRRSKRECWLVEFLLGLAMAGFHYVFTLTRKRFESNVVVLYL